MTERSAVSHSSRAKQLRRGREAFELKAWSQVYEDLSAADRQSPLEPADLFRLAVAARLRGREDEEVDALLERAHRGFLDAGYIPQAVRCAFWLTVTMMQRGAFGPGGGWLARGQRLLEESHLDCVEHGYLFIPMALKALAEGDAAAAYETFQQVAKIAERFADHDLLALSRLGRGLALIGLGEVSEASALFDEAMVAVTAGEVSSLVAGIVFCGVIDACGQVFDLARARQWTAALSLWCDSQPDLVLYRGQCLVYRAEILQLLGAWADAFEQAKLACERLSAPLRPEAGEAFYRLGELHRMTGRFRDAEDAYRRASKLGREPQPGLALLRLGQGKRDIAWAAIKRVAAEAQSASAKCKALLAEIEITLATGDKAAARVAAEELIQAAADFDAKFLNGLIAHARGAVLLAEGDPQAALGFLRRASRIWQELGTPYEAARDRVLVGLACRQMGDEDTAEMEFDAARWAFSDLGAVPDISRVEALARKPPSKAPGGLTMREVQVLRLVAAGETNRTIAGRLFISEKTVDRHLSNIFAKLGVSSRAAATAAAYEKQLF